MGYCARCKITRKIINFEKRIVATSRGEKYSVLGECSTCGTKISRMMSKNMYEGLE